MGAKKVPGKDVSRGKGCGALLLSLVAGAACVGIAGGLAGCGLLPVRTDDPVAENQSRTSGVQTGLSDQVSETTRTFTRSEKREASPEQEGSLEIRAGGSDLQINGLVLGGGNPGTDKGGRVRVEQPERFGPTDRPIDK